ncbi:MAG TPA: hypothetical protein VIM21_00655 [Gemmatimonadaceae bacterium]
MRVSIPASRLPLPASRDESEIRQRFAQLREADRDSAPSFAQMSARARMHRGLGATMRVRPLVIGAAAAVVIVAVWLGSARIFSFHPVTPTVAAITAWRAPTDALLRTPGSEVLGAMPALSASVLDKMIQTPTNRGT